MSWSDLFLWVPLLALCFHGCTFPVKGPSASPTHDNSYTKYWGAEAGSTKLRVAVKDIIDMKGEVTTAGSKYLADAGKPAARDAVCLASGSVRQRPDRRQNQSH